MTDDETSRRGLRRGEGGCRGGNIRSPDEERLLTHYKEKAE